MIEFEDMLVQLQEEGLTLEKVNISTSKEVLHGLKGKKNQGHIEKFKGIVEYLKPYILHVISDKDIATSMAMQLASKPLLGLDIETSKKTDHSQDY